MFMISVVVNAGKDGAQLRTRRDGTQFVTIAGCYNNQYTNNEGKVVQESTWMDIIVNNENVMKAVLAQVGPGTKLTVQSTRGIKAIPSVYLDKTTNKQVATASLQLVDPQLSWATTPSASTRQGTVDVGEGEIELRAGTQTRVLDDQPAAAPATAAPTPRRTGRAARPAATPAPSDDNSVGF